MKATEALRTLSDLTASQWGMVTTAQAADRGVTRMHLSRLTRDGQLVRLGHGVYRDAGTPPDRFSGVKTAWLSIAPALTAEERLHAPRPDAVVSGATAAHVLGLGDLVPEPYEFTVPVRRQTQRDELVFRSGRLTSESITVRDGLPVTTPEQTVADLIERCVDHTLVAGVLADIDVYDRERLIALLAPLARRNGFRRSDGKAFCAELERLAGRDVGSLTKAVAATPVGAELAKGYLKTLTPAVTEHVQESLQVIMQSLTRNLALNNRMQELAAQIVQRLTAPITQQVADLNRQVAQGLADALQPLLDSQRESIESITRAIGVAAPTPDPALARQVGRLVAAVNQANAATPAWRPAHEDLTGRQEDS